MCDSKTPPQALHLLYLQTWQPIITSSLCGWYSHHRTEFVLGASIDVWLGLSGCSHDIVVSYFLGFEVVHHASSISLTQSKYAIDLSHKTQMSLAKPAPTPLSSSSKLSLADSELFDRPSLYRSTVEALQYLTLSCPDIAFAVNQFGQYLQAPTFAPWKACKGVLRYIRGTLSLGLTFTPALFMNLEGYCEADWASDPDNRKFGSGIYIFLGGNRITWSSRKQSKRG